VSSNGLVFVGFVLGIGLIAVLYAFRDVAGSAVRRARHGPERPAEDGLEPGPTSFATAESVAELEDRSGRRALIRDTSTVLVAVGALTLLIVTFNEFTRPVGQVLEATGMPAAGASSVASVAMLASPQSSTPTPDVTAAPSPKPVPTPRPTTKASPARHSAPSASRMAVLTACPRTPDCYLYRVRRGDNLVSIAHWFGVRYETVLRLNPQLRTPSTLHAGDDIRLPTPTR
jgi:hypothetical protein